MHTVDNRNYLLDNLKGFLILLVVLGHSIELFLNNSIVFKTIYIFIYLFHMPFFVFISGYFSKDVEKCRNYAFKTFLVPYIIFNTLWYIVASIATKSLSMSVLSPGWALWYLLSMFFWRLFLKDLIKVKHVIILSIFIGLGIGLLREFNAYLSISRTLVFLPFFLLGYYTTENHIRKIRKIPKFFSIMGIILLLIISIFLSNIDLFPVQFLYGNAAYDSFNITKPFGVLYRFSLYILSCAFIVFLINLMTSKKNIFSKIGQHTFPVYIFHTYLVALSFILNPFKLTVWLNLAYIIICSLVITYVLSLKIFKKYFDKGLGESVKFITKDKL